jgi:hypothetical protein
VSAFPEGDAVNDSSRIVFATAIGAVVGGALGYLFLTDAGRGFRRELEPRIDDFMRELGRLRSAAAKARLAADESLRMLQELSGDRSNRPA